MTSTSDHEVSETVADPVDGSTGFDELDLDTPWSQDRRYKARLMSRWLSPPQLVDAGFKELVAGLFETFADRRESLQARDNVVLIHPLCAEEGKTSYGDPATRLEPRPLLPPDENRPLGDGFWFDYVADIGDGFTSTYSVAAEIAMTDSASKVREFATPHGTQVDLHRGELLVMGGDQVYPLANDEEYRNRTIGPYETACRRAKPPMSVVAVPGNHDWYDGLTAFLSRFCTEQWIGGWQTRQSRSYWAAKLQPGWWVWGIDVALEHSPIDHHQLQYFRSVAAELEPDDRIILVTAKPSWLQPERPGWMQQADDLAGRVFGTHKPESEADPSKGDYQQLSYFMTTTLANVPDSPDHTERPPRFALILSGDKHFYCRYDNEDAEPDERLPHVLAGGGGAYLSLPVRQADNIAVPWPRRRPEGDEGLALAKRVQWPDPEATRKLAGTSLWRMISRNWGFCAVLSAIYLALATAIQSGDREDYTSSWPDNVERSFSALWSSPSLALLGLGLVFAVSLQSKLPLPGKVPLAVIQTSFHLIALSTCAALARLAMSGDVGFSATGWAAIAFLIGASAWGGWGAWIWMIYRKFPFAAIGGFVLLVGLAIAMAVGQWESWAWTILLIGLASVLSGVAFAAGLLVAVALFGDQDNELSVAVREAGFKNFIRLNIDTESNLHVYVIGLEKVPHQRLKFRSDDKGTPHRGTPEVTPVYGEAWKPGAKQRYEPRLIDHFSIPAR